MFSLHILTSVWVWGLLLLSHCLYLLLLLLPLLFSSSYLWSWAFGIFWNKRFGIYFDPSYFEAIVAHNCYNNYLRFSETVVNLMLYCSFHFVDLFSPSVYFLLFLYIFAFIFKECFPHGCPGIRTFPSRTTVPRRIAPHEIPPRTITAQTFVPRTITPK